MIQRPPSDIEKGYLQANRQGVFRLPGQHHFVLGNHCVENLTKPEFLGIVGQEQSYYSFDAAGYHFVILDACFTSDEKPYGRKNFKWADAKIPPAELEWLQADIGQSSHKSIVCIHQCLDMIPPYGVRMAPRFARCWKSPVRCWPSCKATTTGELPGDRRFALLHDVGSRRR